MTSPNSSVRSQSSAPRSSNYIQPSLSSHSSGGSSSSSTRSTISPYANQKMPDQRQDPIANFKSKLPTPPSSERPTPFLKSGSGQSTSSSSSRTSGKSHGSYGSVPPSSNSSGSHRRSSNTSNGASGVTLPQVTSLSLSTHLSSSYTSTSNAGFSTPSLPPLNMASISYPSSFNFISLPSSSFGGTSFSPQPPSLSGRIERVIPVLTGPQMTLPYGNQELSVWTPPSLSSVRSPSLPVTHGRVSGNVSFPQYHRTNSSTSDTQFRNSVLRKLEETTKILHQMHASPERLFTTWQTKGLTPLAICINPQTTLFVDPLNVSGVFQSVSSAQVQEARASQEGRSASLGRAIAIVSSTEKHSITKYVGIFLKNTLLVIQQLNPNSRHLHLDEKSLSEAWETEAVPAIHRSMDNAYGTSIGANYNPNNDGRMQQAVQNFVLDPLWLFPMGRLVEGVNLTLRGATVTIQEIGSAIKTARVALETPLAIKPAFANVGNMSGQPAAILENAVATEAQAAIAAQKMAKNRLVGPSEVEIPPGTRVASTDTATAIKTQRIREPVRTDPKNLQEQLTLEEAKSNSVAPEVEIMKDKIKDPNYPATIWKKVSHTHENPDGTHIDVHFWENRFTGEKKEFKFKDQKK